MTAVSISHLIVRLVADRPKLDRWQPSFRQSRLSLRVVLGQQSVCVCSEYIYPYAAYGVLGHDSDPAEIAALRGE